MFQELSTLPADPILGLNQQFLQDKNPHKINLSVGVYQDAQGNTPIFSAVKKAEQQVLAAQQSKTYIPQAGDPQYLQGIVDLVFGTQLSQQLGDRVAAVMTPGGCGALRMLAELLVAANPQAKVWVSDPTWANHYPLLQSAGLSLATYAYYDPAINGINFSAMLDSLQQIPSGDVVLLHGCCHNPTGADLSNEQWDQVLEILLERKLLAFIDTAYQGFGHGLDADAYGIRQAVQKLPEVIIANSCSKNFGLYRERTGTAIVVTESAQVSAAARSHIMTAARRCYSMSPYHGAGIAGVVLADTELRNEWRAELEQVRSRMNTLREGLANGLNEAQSKIDFSFVAQSNGMFCYLGIPLEAVHVLRSEYAIYLLDSTRINVAGLSEQNLPVVIDRVAEIICRE